MFEIQSVEDMKRTMAGNYSLMKDPEKNAEYILSNHHNLLLSLIHREEEWERMEGDTLEWKSSSCRKPKTKRRRKIKRQIEQLVDDIHGILTQEGVVDSYKIEETLKTINEFSQTFKGELCN